jgi:diguanylate cyclase (GGDEF)-like protein
LSLPAVLGIIMSLDHKISAPSSAESIRCLLAAVQELSHVHSLHEVTAIVRKAARELTRCDGATFVLRDNDQCYYADEDAIEPLWRGRRFPMEICISGWVMLNKSSTVIEDIYQDTRIPHQAYRPTFVKSLAMVPIRSREPIGAIGNYWADNHTATAEELGLLQALADATSLALQHISVKDELKRMNHASITDELTGLLNRRGFYVQAEAALSLASRLGKTAYVAFIDLDHLKKTNDREGHDAGDNLIRKAANSMRQVLGEDAVIARMGGDEFCLLTTDAHSEKDWLYRMREELNRQQVSASIGVVAACSSKTWDLSELMTNADSRMYADKQVRRSS